VPRSRILALELYLHFPVSLHSVVFNYLSTGTNLPVPYEDKMQKDELNWMKLYESYERKAVSHIQSTVMFSSG
jgi:hypothetical protein